MYAFLDPISTLSFVTFLVASKCDTLLEILHKQHVVSTPIGYYVRAERVYRDCPITVLNKVTHVHLIELTMIDFDIILTID